MFIWNILATYRVRTRHRSRNTEYGVAHAIIMGKDEAGLMSREQAGQGYTDFFSPVLVVG